AALAVAEHARADRAVGEGVGVEPGGRREGARTDLAAQHDGQARGGAAGQVGHAENGRPLLRGDQRARGKLDDAAHERYAKFLDAEAARPALDRRPLRLSRGRRHDEDHLVAPELGGARDRPRALRTAVVAPGERLVEVLVAAEMADREDRGTLLRRNGGEALERLLP